jgi:acyl-ACP thioesterase
VSRYADDRGGFAADTDFEPFVPQPERGRVFRAERRVRLSDADASGRLRLDAVARYLQDVATDDVAETGWGAGEHFWLVRRTAIQQVRPFAIEETVDLTTWSSGAGTVAASRRTSLKGNRGGLIETESIWAHLGRDFRPLRLGEDFYEVYGESTCGRRISHKLELAGLAEGALREPWPLRLTDIDVLGHVNNAAFWEAVEEVAARDSVRLDGTFEAVLEFRRPIDSGDAVELVRVAGPDGLRLALTVAGDERAIALVRLAATPGG